MIWWEEEKLQGTKNRTTFVLDGMLWEQRELSLNIDVFYKGWLLIDLLYVRIKEALEESHQKQDSHKA